jgi:hypothetical protein
MAKPISAARQAKKILFMVLIGDLLTWVRIASSVRVRQGPFGKQNTLNLARTLEAMRTQAATKTLALRGT